MDANPSENVETKEQFITPKRTKSQRTLVYINHRQTRARVSKIKVNFVISSCFCADLKRVLPVDMVSPALAHSKLYSPHLWGFQQIPYEKTFQGLICLITGSFLLSPVLTV